MTNESEQVVTASKRHTLLEGYLEAMGPRTEDGKALKEVVLILSAIDRCRISYVADGVVSYLSRKENMNIHLLTEGDMQAIKAAEAKSSDE